MSYYEYHSNAEGLVFESQPRQTEVKKKPGSDSSTAKRSAMECLSRVLGDDRHKQMPLVTVR